MNRSWLGVKLLVAVAVLLAVAAGILIRYSDGAVQIPPTPAWTVDVQAEDECAQSAVPQFRLDAPAHTTIATPASPMPLGNTRFSL